MSAILPGLATGLGCIKLFLFGISLLRSLIKQASNYLRCIIMHDVMHKQTLAHYIQMNPCPKAATPDCRELEGLSR